MRAGTAIAGLRAWFPMMGSKSPARLRKAVARMVIIGLCVAGLCVVFCRWAGAGPPMLKSCRFPADAKSYSQGGEDVALYERYFCAQRAGTFVEMGARDGTSESTTKFFEDYLSWSGVLIEAQHENAEKLRFSTRDKSTKIFGAACLDSRTVDFLGGPAIDGRTAPISRADQNTAKELGPDQSVGRAACAPLGTWLNMAGLEKADVFVLDVDGAELQVLETMDWTIPVGVWVVELDGSDSTKDNAVRALLGAHGYSPPIDWQMFGPNEVFESEGIGYSQKRYIDDATDVDHVFKKNATIPKGKVSTDSPSLTFTINTVDDATILNPTSSSVGLVVTDCCVYSLHKWFWAFGAEQVLPAQDLNAESTRQYKELPDYRLQRLKAEARRVEYEVISFDMVWSDYFQHVVLDTLPRAALACDWIKTNAGVKVGVAGVEQQRLIQEVCTIPDERFRITRGGTCSYAKVYIPHLQVQFDGENPSYRHGIALPGSIPPLGGNTRGSKIVFLWRAASTTRNLNQEEMVAALRTQFGASSVDVYEPHSRGASGLNTHGEAKEALRDARVIIGVHGGALANMIFAPTGATIIEINKNFGDEGIAAEGVRACYVYQALSLGFRHVNIPAVGFSYGGPDQAYVDVAQLVDAAKTTMQ